MLGGFEIPTGVWRIPVEVPSFLSQTPLLSETLSDGSSRTVKDRQAKRVGSTLGTDRNAAGRARLPTMCMGLRRHRHGKQRFGEGCLVGCRLPAIHVSSVGLGRRHLTCLVTSRTTGTAPERRVEGRRKLHLQPHPGRGLPGPGGKEPGITVCPWRSPWEGTLQGADSRKWSLP